MNWSDVIVPPKPKTLRQFAGLWLLCFGGLAAWRAWHGVMDARTETLGMMAAVIGGLGLARPAAIRWIYSGWMILAFPIGWIVSRLMVMLLFYVLFTPIALVFRLMGRDALHLRRAQAASYWTPKAQPADVKDYFRQS